MLPASPTATRVLAVEDCSTDVHLVCHALSRSSEPFVVQSVATLAAATDRLKGDERVDVVLLDLGLPDCRGLEGLHVLRATRPDVPVVIMTGSDDDTAAIQAVRTGAQDYMTKTSADYETLPRTLRLAIERHRNVVRLADTASRLAVARDELLDLAHRDPLTGILNRRGLEAATARRLSSSEGVDVTALFVDLDDFKEINVRFGHHGGDTVLVETAHRLGNAAHPDDLCGRLGGDEFMVLTFVRRGAAVGNTAERVRAALAAPITIGAAVPHPTASIAVGTHRGPDLTIGKLLRRCQSALRRSKTGGKNRISVASTAPPSDD